MMKYIPLGWAMLSLLTIQVEAAYPIETYPPDVREQGYPNTVTIPAPKPPLSQAEQQRAEKASSKPEVVIIEHKRLLPLLICEKKIAKEDRHLVKSCHHDAEKLYLTTQKGVELVSAKDSRDEDLYLGKHNHAHEIKNVLADESIYLVLTTLKNKRYQMELITSHSSKSLGGM